MRKTDLNYLVDILSRHLKAVSVHYNVEMLQLCLLSCPTDITAFSIVQAYTCLGAEAAVFRANYASALTCGQPFLAQLNYEGNDSFVFVKKITNDFVEYYEGNRKRWITASDFQVIWTGVMITIEKTKIGDDRFIIVPHSFFYSMLLPLLLFVIGFLLFDLSYSMHAIVDCILDICGCILCVGVIVQVKFPYYNIFDRLCSANEKFDCHSLHLEKWGRLFSKVSLGRIGTVYFATCVFAILLSIFCVNSSAVQEVLNLPSLLGLIVVFSSVSYQLIEKKYCLLCLMIMGILAIKGFLCFPVNNFHYDFSLSIISCLLIAVLIGCITLFVIEYLFNCRIGKIKTRVNELQIKRIQGVLKYFFLQKPSDFVESNAVVIGNADAPLTITTYLSPWCKACKEIALEMINLVNNYPHYIKWQVFLDGIKSEKIYDGNMMQICLYSYLKREIKTRKKLDILKLWYKTNSERKLLQKIGMSSVDLEAELDLFNNQLDLMSQEKKLPVVWINQRCFPSCYSLKDLPYVILDLCIIYSKKK